LNELKAKEPQTRTFASKTWQTGNIISHVDKNYLNTHDNIQQLKTAVNLHRKQISKYKDTIARLQRDTQELLLRNNATNQENIDLETNNEQIKEEIMQYR
jgi:predicted RNase H-like nuclease (RuvC/YqgF family)